MTKQSPTKPQQCPVVIAPHLMTDFDGLASAVAAWKLHPEAVIALPGGTERSVARFQEEFPGIAPILAANEIDLESVERLIVVDTGRWERLGPLAALKEREVAVTLYDHHGSENSDLPTTNAIVGDYGANVSALVEMLRARDLSVTPQEATLLAIGIYEDTGMLTFEGVTPADFEAAAWLLVRGAKMRLARRFLPVQLEHDQWSLLERIRAALTFPEAGSARVALAVMHLDEQRAELAVLAQRLMDVEQPDGLVLVLQMAERIHVVARSSGDRFDAEALCAPLGGGGHKQAASATLRKLTLAEAEQRVRAALPAAVVEQQSLREIMSYPVRSVGPETKLTDALDLLNKFHINNLCVTQDGALVGVLNRQMVDRAVHHDLGDMAAEELMSTAWQSLTPDTSLDEAQKVLLSEKLRFAPVMDGGKLVGVVSRTDLLKLVFDRETRKTSQAFDARQVRTIEKNIGAMMRQRLAPELFEKVGHVREIADEMGLPVCLVGGIVRDVLLDRENSDIDIVVEGDGLAFARRLAERIGGKAHLVPKFHTAKAAYPDGYYIDVASARMEYYERPVALPTVEHGSLRQDLYRRDFTINALAVWLNEERFGEILDPFGGRDDLRNGRIRVIHSLSFLEDPTRMLRAVRFASRFGFEIEPQTRRFMKAALRRDVFRDLSGDRLLNEMKYLLRGRQRKQAMAMLHELKLLPVIHQDLTWSEEREALFESLEEVLGWYRLNDLQPSMEEWPVFLAGLFHGFGLKAIGKAAKRLNATREERAVLEAGAQASALAHRLRDLGPDAPPSRVYEACRGESMECLLLLMAAHQGSALAERCKDHIQRLRHVERELTGEHLKEMGIPPGRIFRDLLDMALFARMDGLVSTLDEERAYVAQMRRTLENRL